MRYTSLRTPGSSANRNEFKVRPLGKECLAEEPILGPTDLQPTTPCIAIVPVGLRANRMLTSCVIVGLVQIALQGRFSVQR
jgi:hypothetical protein